MPVLQSNEYDASYFDGSSQPLQHNAGYGKYERWQRHEGEDSSGEYWLDYAKSLFNEQQMAGAKVLDIGCAKGFVVEDLRSLGVDAYGIDVSQYAIDQASEAVKPYLTVGDVRTALSQYGRNEFDVVFSLRVLECFDDTDLPDLIDEMNRISRYQFHVIDEQPNSSYYNVKSLDEWENLNFAKKTQLASRESKEVRTV